MALHPRIHSAAKKQQIVKIIAGLSNFNLQQVLIRVKAAEIGGATYVDIAANMHILLEVKKISSLPICVSSIDPYELANCFNAGADMLEIGNFDVFYEKGINFSAQQILALAQKTINLVPSASICVTMPHTLSLHDQIALSKKLELLGVDMIQTEGVGSKFKLCNNLLGSINKASASLSSTYALIQDLSIPIISASGITPLSAPVAVSYGASGVGIGSFLSFHDSILDASISIDSIVRSISYPLDTRLTMTDLLLLSINVNTLSTLH
jgi:Protein of unknown function (DUF561)